MVLLCKRVVGVVATLIIGGSSVALAEMGAQESPAQLRNKLRQAVRPANQVRPATQVRSATQQPARPLTPEQQQQLRAVQKSVAVIVKIPKDASGRELKDQAKIALRLNTMVQPGQGRKDIESIWNKETVDATNFDRARTNGSNEMSSTEANYGEMNNEQWRGGWGWRGGVRPGWGGGFRPGWGGGFRPGFGWSGGFRPGWGWGGGFRPGFGWAGFRPFPVARPFFYSPVGFYGYNAPFFYGYPAYNYYYYPYAGFNPYGFGGCC